MSYVAGLDGCSGGWVIVRVSSESGGPAKVERITDLSAVVASLRSGELAAGGIDIPIGLPGTGQRLCDGEARRLLGPRRSSVFPAPVRPVLAASSYDETLAISRRVDGRGLSRQAYGLLEKIREVDDLIDPPLQERLVEVHPEVSFSLMAGHPMLYYKRTPAGADERLDTLRPHFPDVAGHYSAGLAGAGRDDLLDAFAVTWSAQRVASGREVRLGSGTDDRGLRMEIVA